MSRESEIYQSFLETNDRKTDRMFSYLFVFQWILGIILAAANSPLSWEGNQSFIHPHLWSAVFLGGVVSLFPVFLILKNPGHPVNKYIATVAQMLTSTLLIHYTNGRLETHFHVFGSLAFLAFYRDVRPLILGTLITAVDHFIRGLFFTESIYGILMASPWRALEHASWVVFEDIFLVIGINSRNRYIRDLAFNQARIEETLATVEEKVRERTQELEESQKLVYEQQASLINSSKLSSLGVMAAGVAHEVNNPLAIISNAVTFVKKQKQRGILDDEALLESMDDIESTVKRISQIIVGLRNLSRDSKDEEHTPVTLQEILHDVLGVCQERFKHNSVDFEIKDRDQLLNVPISCMRVQISQVLMNLLMNSFDAVQDLEEKWIKLTIEKTSSGVSIQIIDSGKGISDEIIQKIFKPFFTTKDVGKGTGLGLSLSMSIIEKHKGKLFVDKNSPNTKFVVELPLAS
jgi:two-component system, NtrC family, sensor histidine kinase HydH